MSQDDVKKEVALLIYKQSCILTSNLIKLMDEPIPDSNTINTIILNEIECHLKKGKEFNTRFNETYIAEIIGENSKIHISIFPNPCEDVV